MAATLKERMAQSETRVVKVVFPNTTNHYHTLFGGTAMQLMDETAFIAATRFCRKKVVTLSTSKIDLRPQFRPIRLSNWSRKLSNWAKPVWKYKLSFTKKICMKKAQEKNPFKGLSLLLL